MLWTPATMMPVTAIVMAHFVLLSIRIMSSKAD
jgi:hypothetical protein